MDGVLQSPGGKDEDPTNGFKWGGWQFGYPDEQTNKKLTEIFSSPFDLLLGRRTYEIFAAYWPYQKDEIAEKFNKVNKYVVGTTPIDTSWENSTLINKDVIDELKKLKQQDGPDLLVHGSSRLIQTLLANKLIDVLHIWTYPITLGKGKKLFQEGTPAQEWTITDSTITPTGIIIATYLPGGEVKLGSFESASISDREIARRKKWANEEKAK
jgi:dihydrofolate reductase